MLSIWIKFLLYHSIIAQVLTMKPRYCINIIATKMNLFFFTIYHFKITLYILHMLLKIYLKLKY